MDLPMVLEEIYGVMTAKFNGCVKHYHGDLIYDRAFLVRCKSQIMKIILRDSTFDGAKDRLVYSVGMCGSHIGIMGKDEPPVWLHPSLDTYRRYTHFELVSKPGEPVRLEQRSCEDLGASADRRDWEK